ncbi:MAG: zinc-ribbon domain-containing protein, partial [Gemmatimonadota bacterium]|nr:zinc-ribbon domain-containing protein [Gemmatimonadota bacterium]
MNVVCPECRSVFRVDPGKVPGTSVRARCSVCGGVLTIGANADARTEFAAAPNGMSALPAAAAPARVTAPA